MQVLQEAFEVRGGIDPRPALALGGGIGHAGDVCGAVTGGAIAIGLLVGDHVADVQQAKNKAKELALPYYRDFQAQFGTVDCCPLIGIDISTDEGFQTYKASDRKEKVCSGAVNYAVRRLLPLAEQFAKKTEG
ncbi:MAG: C-GCAxxG-C-C family protein [Chloroflexota bacterium]